MPIYSAVGEALVTQDELYEDASKSRGFTGGGDSVTGAATVELSTGEVTPENLFPASQPPPASGSASSL